MQSTCWHTPLQIILKQSQKYIYLCKLKSQTTAYCCSAVQYDQSISDYEHFWSLLCCFSNCLILTNCRGEGVWGCYFNQNKMSIQTRIGKDKFKNHLEWIYDVCYTQMWKLLLTVPKIKRRWIINYWIRNLHRCLVFKIRETHWFQGSPLIFIFSPGPVLAQMVMKKATPYLLFSWRVKRKWTAIKQNHTSKALSEILHDCLRGSFSISLLQWRLFSPHEGRNKTAYLAFFQRWTPHSSAWFVKLP